MGGGEFCWSAAGKRGICATSSARHTHTHLDEPLGLQQIPSKVPCPRLLFLPALPPRWLLLLLLLAGHASQHYLDCSGNK